MPVTVAAIAFLVVTIGAIAFQIALALGAPWGAYAMGGGSPGRLPMRLRVAAAAQGLIIAALAVIVAGKAALITVPLVADLPWLAWLVVAFSALSLVLNSISRSSGERRIWVPVAIVMLAASLVVAIGDPAGGEPRNAELAPVSREVASRSTGAPFA